MGESELNLYQKPCALLLRVEMDHPVFGNLEDIFVIDNYFSSLCWKPATSTSTFKHTQSITLKTERFYCTKTYPPLSPCIFIVSLWMILRFLLSFVNTIYAMCYVLVIVRKSSCTGTSGGVKIVIQYEAKLSTVWSIETRHECHYIQYSLISVL